jgi:hypothetical protein
LSFKGFYAGILKNIVCLPYQPLHKLAGSLSAADLHVAVMGDRFVGTIHPCKIYNIFSVGAPLLYVGPEESHIADIVREMNPVSASQIAHGDVEGLIKVVRTAAAHRERANANLNGEIRKRFAQRCLLPQMISALETAGGSSRQS